MKTRWFSWILASAAVALASTGNAWAAEAAKAPFAPAPFALDGAYSTGVAAAETKVDGDVSATRYVAADGKLALDVRVRTFDGFPVREISTSLTNLSATEPTDVVQNLRVFADSFALPNADSTATLDLLRGSTCVPEDFAPLNFALKAGEEKTFATPSGRSSSEFTPFIDASFGDKTGALFAIGWTGDWKARFANEGGSLRVELGMERCGMKLNPGETLLQPSVLVFERQGQTRREFKTVVHRFMREHMSPRDAEGKIVPPILAITAGGGNKTPQMMLDILQYRLDAGIPCDTYWVDAGWYGAPHETDPYPNCGPDWYRFVGDWRVNTTTHPTGDLLPIADAVHKAGMRFLLWFEPERVHESAPVVKENPDFVEGALYNYANPEALKRIQEIVYGTIEKHGIDVYRQDFNMEPTGFWARLEAKEGEHRVGAVEAKHVAALYKFLDDMRARFPNILLENCASGGRRIDFEMVRRAHSYCRSDYFIGMKPGDTAINLGQNMTLNSTPFLPFQGGETNCVAVGDNYGFMSVVSSGTVFTPTDFDGGIVRRKFTDAETAWFQKMFGLTARLQAYYMGDFYPLTDETGAADDVWCGWSLHRPTENDGFALVFRRADAPEETKTFELPAVDPTAKYEVEYFDGTKEVVSGAELAKLEVKLAPRSFFLAIYKKI